MTTRYPYWVQAMIVAVPALLAWARPNPVAYWISEGPWLGLGLAGVYAAALLACLDLAVRRTWFLEDGIDHRSRIGRHRFIRYADIAHVVATIDHATRITAIDGTRVKVWAKEADPMVLVELLTPLVGAEARIVVR